MNTPSKGSPSATLPQTPLVSSCATRYSTILEHFKPGDLIFGLKKTRKEILDVLATQGHQYCFANALNNRTITTVIKNRPIDELAPHKHQHALYLQKHLAYLSKPHGKPIPVLHWKGNLRSAAYRRACKLLLIEDDAQYTYRRHFFLAGIDWQRVTHKSYLDDNNVARTDFGVSASELRAAYRYYKAHGNHPLIVYYSAEGQPIAPPWEQTALIPLFQAYDQLQKEKLLLEDADTEVEVEDDELIEKKASLLTESLGEHKDKHKYKDKNQDGDNTKGIEIPNAKLHHQQFLPPSIHAKQITKNRLAKQNSAHTASITRFFQPVKKRSHASLLANLEGIKPNTAAAVSQVTLVIPENEEQVRKSRRMT